ncbi:MAG: hypothetical protein F6K28_43530 [Microcoleus sp. SIO2G3]|nr:hypothetical protein [Microcoleus sp. SIO2G3]
MSKRQQGRADSIQTRSLDRWPYRFDYSDRQNLRSVTLDFFDNFFHKKSADREKAIDLLRRLEELVCFVTTKLRAAAQH